VGLKMKNRLKGLAIAFLITMLFLTASSILITYGQTTTVFLDVPDTVTLGTITVRVNITDVVGLYGWEFKLYYNNTLLTFQSYTVAGHFLEQGGTTFQIDKSNNNYNSTHGLVWLADTLLGAPSGVSGSGPLVTLTFNATGKGKAYLIFEDLLPTMDGKNIKLGDKSANPIQNIAYDKIVTIKAELNPPVITNVVQNPPADNVLPTDSVTVNATVTDESGVKNVTLYYSTDEGATWNNITMVNVEGDIYTTETPIPPQSLGTHVKYKIVAFDLEDNMAVNDNAGNYFVYTVVPEFTTPLIFILIILATVTIMISRTKAKKQA